MFVELELPHLDLDLEVGGGEGGGVPKSKYESGAAFII